MDSPARSGARPPPKRAKGGWRRDLIWRLESVGFAGFIGFMRLMDVERASALGGWLLRTLGPKTGVQKTVMRNLRIAYPEMSPEARERLALDQWEQTGRAFAETAVMDRLVAEGRIEVVGGANNPYVDAQIRAARARYGIRLFAPKGGDGARELLAGMARGESVALMNDQKFAEGPEVQFFGQPVNAAPGPTRLALRCGTVLQPMSVVRLPGVRFRLTVHEPIEPERTGDRPADIVRGVQAITSFIEDRVRENPVDWFWVHKRWPDRVYAALEPPREASPA